MRDTTTWVCNLLIALIIWNFEQCRAISAGAVGSDESGFTGDEDGCARRPFVPCSRDTHKDFSIQGTLLPETIILESPSSTPNFTYFLEGKETSNSNYDDSSESRASSSSNILDRSAAAALMSALNRQNSNNGTELNVERNNKYNDFKKNDDESVGPIGGTENSRKTNTHILRGQSSSSSSTSSSPSSSISFQDTNQKNYQRDKSNDQWNQNQQQEEQNQQSQSTTMVTATTTAPDNHYKQNDRVLEDNSMRFYGLTNRSNDSEDAVTNHKISAFELHKSHRKKNKRYGHKIQKKKYKDYLKHSFNRQMILGDDQNDHGINVAIPSKEPTDTSPRANMKDVMMKQYNRETERSKTKAGYLLSNHPIFSIHPAKSTSNPYYQGQMNFFAETNDETAAENWNKKTPDSDPFDVVPTRSSSYRNGMKLLPSVTPDQYSPTGRNKHHSYQWENHKNRQHLRSRSNPSISRSLNRHQHHHGQSDQRHHQHHYHHQNHRYNHNHHRKVMLPAIANEDDVNSSGLGWRNYYNSAPSSTSQFNQYPASSQVGHQITQMEEFDKYYSKWPHLARLQYQLNEDYAEGEAAAAAAAKGRANYHYKSPTRYHDSDETFTATDGIWQKVTEQKSDDNPEKMDRQKSDDYDDNDDYEDENLPPYIKKYNRRNKLLLNLLEGTLPPPSSPPPLLPEPTSQSVFRVWSSSVLQPGPRDTNPYAMRTKPQNENRNTKRKYEDIFGEQRTKWDKSAEQVVSTIESQSSTFNVDTTNNSIIPTSTTITTTTTLSPFDELLSRENDDLLVLQNQLPGDDINISQELFDWEKDIATDYNGDDTKDWNIEKTLSSSSLSSSSVTSKPIKQHSSGLIAVPRNRGGNRRSNFIGGPSNFRSNTMFSVLSAAPTPLAFSSKANDSSIENTKGISTPKPINSFVYHRVVEAPRLVGAGLTGRKQRLPFVAITDRRLETSKKIRQKDFEQNHYPMP